jgi:ABC-2 type transport system ATP-binding protein
MNERSFLMSIIAVENLTKDYGHGRGVFDVTFTVQKGEVFGFLGPNGAGKTTLIRQMMGFTRPNNGSIKVNGLDAWRDSVKIRKCVGYLPGEIAFPDMPTGKVFLRRHAELLELDSMDYANEIIDLLQLDPGANLKRMSKGMKQKTSIVAAFMHNPDILVLDEPTSGLDPLMRVEVLELIHREKAKGKTIFMSSHLFDEVERCCDTVAIIKEGRVISQESIKEITKNHSLEQYFFELYRGR